MSDKKISQLDDAAVATGGLINMVQSGVNKKAVVTAAGAKLMEASDRPAAVAALFAAGTLTSDVKVLDASATWNNAGVAFTALKLNVTDSASAAASLLADLQVGGVSKLRVTKAGSTTIAGPLNVVGNVVVGSYGPVIYSVNGQIRGQNHAGLLLGSSAGTSGDNVSDIFAKASATLNWNGDLVIARDAPDTLAQCRGANAQAYRLYNTYTDGSNYERADIAWASNELIIGTDKAGTGSARTMKFKTGGVNRWVINSLGHLTANGDNVYDFGATGAMPRNGYFGTDVFCRNTIQSPQSSVTLGTNGQLAFEATDNSTITVKFRGSDGTTRSATIALT